MSSTPLSRSPDLERLREDGYEVFIQAGFLVVDNVPYVDAVRAVQRGRLVSELTMEGDVTARPQTHVVLFSGSIPCDQNGVPITALGGGDDQRTLDQGLTVARNFSSKPTSGYADYYEKMSTYAAILSGPAATLDPTATARTFAFVEAPDDDSPFVYVDTASARSRITVVMDKLKVERLAIVGLGGTGSYILDLVAKAPVGQIDLYDGDRFRQHNAFRSPGAATRAQLAAASNKADYFAAIYSAIHKNIISHPYHLDESNVHELAGARFVFIAIDRGTLKGLLIDTLEELGIPFLDVGMGVSVVDGSLGGVLRMTMSMPGRPTVDRNRISLAESDVIDDYAQNIQIADLNALNATLAVIKWKKTLGFYRDLELENYSAYTIDGNHLLNEDHG